MEKDGNSRVESIGRCYATSSKGKGEREKGRRTSKRMKTQNASSNSK